VHIPCDLGQEGRPQPHFISEPQSHSCGYWTSTLHVCSVTRRLDACAQHRQCLVWYLQMLQGGRVKLELSSKHLMPQSARPIRAAWCPTLPSDEPEYVALGSEDCSVYVYDVSGAPSLWPARNLLPCSCCRQSLHMLTTIFITMIIHL
jgi:hypothetical protein